jgi:hypothetical protein
MLRFSSTHVSRSAMARPIARADLQRMNAGVEGELDVAVLHHLGVDRQAGAARSLHQDVQGLHVALEGIWVRPRFPNAATQHVGAGFLHRGGRLVEIVGVLRVDRARPRNHQQLFAQRHATERDAVTGEVGTLVHQLERRLDPVDPVDVGQALEPVDHQLVALIADDGVDRPHRADDGLDLAAELADDGGDFGQLFRREAVGLGEDHDGSRRP